MSSKVETFTSTGGKLIHNPQWLREVIENGRILPLSIECAPESRCNLMCNYCSNKDRKTDESLSADVLLPVLESMRGLGTKTIQWTGGGEFLMHPQANLLIKECHRMGYQQGLITNGTMFHALGKEALEKLTWVRVSLNIEVLDRIIVPEIPETTTLGFSCVVTEDMDEAWIKEIRNFVSAHNPEYVRVVTNCLVDNETQIANNDKLGKMVAEWGSPFFYQRKDFRKPAKCWWFWAKPFVHHDTYIYRCSSIVLNQDSENRFHEKYRVCKLDELPDQYKKKAFPVIPTSCESCVFAGQNDLIDSLLNKNGMESFV